MSAMIIVPDAHGARTVEWTPDDAASVETARAEFDSMMAAGYGAAIDDETVREFNPAAESITVWAPIAGG